jgi:hypothetical protein
VQITFGSLFHNICDFHAAKKHASVDREVHLSFYLEEDAAFKRLKALSTTKRMSCRRGEKDRLDLHETLGVPNLSGGIDDLFIGSERLMTIGASII